MDKAPIVNTSHSTRRKDDPIATWTGIDSRRNRYYWNARVAGYLPHPEAFGVAATLLTGERRIAGAPQASIEAAQRSIYGAPGCGKYQPDFEIIELHRLPEPVSPPPGSVHSWSVPPQETTP